MGGFFCYEEVVLLGVGRDLACGAVERECFAAVEHGKIFCDIGLVKAWQAKCVAKYLIDLVASFVNDSIGE